MPFRDETPRGTYWRHVSWDQFADEKTSFEYADMDAPKAGLQKAKVLKITDVKPGQEFPTAKRGQGQLFRMQVWPKGFTPSRQRHVQMKMDKAASVDDYAEEGLGKESNATSKQQLKAQARNAIARSTIPTSDVNTIRNTRIILGGEPDGSAGGFMDPNPSTPEIHVHRPPPTNADSVRDLFTDSLLIHEMGHRVDYEQDEERFSGSRSYRSAVYGNEQVVNPVHEGVAMGYQLAHFRTTRNQRRRAFKLVNKLKSPMQMGYKADNFSSDENTDNKGIEAQDAFMNKRLTTFRAEKGLTPHPLQEQRTDSPKYQQDKLPGM